MILKNHDVIRLVGVFPKIVIIYMYTIILLFLAGLEKCPAKLLYQHQEKIKPIAKDFPGK